MANTSGAKKKGWTREDLDVSGFNIYMRYNVLVMWCLYKGFPDDQLSSKYKPKERKTKAKRNSVYDVIKIDKNRYYRIIQTNNGYVPFYVSDVMKKNFGLKEKYFTKYDKNPDILNPIEKEEAFKERVLLPEIMVEEYGKKREHSVTQEVVEEIRKKFNGSLSVNNGKIFWGLSREDIEKNIITSIQEKVIYNSNYDGPLKSACIVLKEGVPYDVRLKTLYKINRLMKDLDNISPRDWWDYFAYNKGEGNEECEATMKMCRDILTRNCDLVSSIHNIDTEVATGWTQKWNRK